jgi:hypothetical protein
MTHERTDPIETPPPPVTEWNVIFTRKVAAGAASDPGFIDTGLVYDSIYEYYMAGKLVDSPSPNISGPAVTTAIFNGAETMKAAYRPNGVTAIAITGSAELYIQANQDISSLLSGVVETLSTGQTTGKAIMRIDGAGKFYSKWVAEAAKDGHFVIARRRRYG